MSFIRLFEGPPSKGSFRMDSEHPSDPSDPSDPMEPSDVGLAHQMNAIEIG